MAKASGRLVRDWAKETAKPGEGEEDCKEGANASCGKGRGVIGRGS